MRARDFLIVPLLLTACGGDDGGTGPEPPANLTGELAYLGGDGIVIRDFGTGETRNIKLNTEGLGAAGGMSWQPDGRALVYGVLNLDRLLWEVHRVPIAGSPVTVLSE